MEDKEIKSPGRSPRSMVAPSPVNQEPLQPIDKLAAERGVPPHALAGMCRYYGWAEGKQLAASEFEAKMDAYRVRPMGSGLRG
jgi:hypothetical protein